MRTLPSGLAATVFLAIACLPAMLRAADDDDSEVREAVRAAQRRLHTPGTTQRLKAIRSLRDLPGLEAAQLIAPSLLVDPKTEIQQAAYETLLTWKERREVCIYLSRVLDKELHKKKGRLSLLESLLAVLLASDTPQVQGDLKNLLDTSMAKAHDGIPAVITVADAWGKQGDQQALAALRRMAGLKYFSDVFACRRAVIQAMAAIRLPEAVDTLVGLLPNVDGEVRGDVVRHLTAVTHQQLGVDIAAWQAWWKQHKDGFEFPAKGAETPLAAAVFAGLPSYYGMPIQARRLVFVIDVSGSMEGLRLLTAKREMMRAINALPADAAFSIVAFSSRVGIWQRKLMPATPAGKQKAAQFVYGLRAGGETAAYDALEAAFGFDVEAVYFLSDGDPNAGKISKPAAIIDAMVQANHMRRISVYTIGIAPGQPGSLLDNFMRSLAEENLGVYRRVDH
jgi:hypothetical protein